MAVGSRSHLENEALAKRSWYRNFLMRGFHLLVLSVAGGAIRDTQCGFKVSFSATSLLLACYPLLFSVAGSPIRDTLCGFQVSCSVVCLLLFYHLRSCLLLAGPSGTPDAASRQALPPPGHPKGCMYLVPNIVHIPGVSLSEVDQQVSVAGKPIKLTQCGFG